MILFNKNPDQGIELLINNDMIPSALPKHIANFLITTEGINKDILGQFFGSPKEKN